MEYSVSSTDVIDSVVPDEFGGMWFFRDALGCENLGMTLLELEPGGEGKPHDHAGENHEEVYLVVDGELTVELGEAEGEFESEETLAAGEAIRVAADTWRRLENAGDDPVRVAIAGAP
ncbi:cupin domain-containing protein [Natronomonas sp. F2-12]|jgi:quercetin dioxygenase-like cupin family protein|uniref:Cupin domain-containing protein n=1 Tax=Natronomonas aquatica TaxID=2841590 RepID=A0A9R1CQD6_9EURY|nr:cupin domain-containing protein [Natronomonas aquatica]MCQ4331908.1 cupin domain-containing protein [Natronomonas aquatica]